MRRVKRSNPTLLRLALGSILLSLPLHFGSVAAFGQGSPNVVMILSDDQGWTDWQKDAVLNPTGSVLYETPNLLRLAQQSVNFTNAYASAPICSPSRLSLLTGKSPARTKLTQFLPLPPSYPGTNVTDPTGVSQGIALTETTLAESFHAAGYSTAFMGKWHLGAGPNSVNPLNHGFDVNIGGNQTEGPGSVGGYFAGSDGGWPTLPGLAGPYAADKYLSDAIDDKAVDYITQHANGNTPFFLEMAEYVPHIPLEAPADRVTYYQNKINTLQGQGVDLKGQVNPTYAAMIEKLDQSVGRLLDRLDDPDSNPNTADSVRNSTVVVFASDNGGVYGADASPFPTRNLPLREGKGSMYEGGIRVPMMVSWTGDANMAQGTVTSARTSTYDLYPTLLDLAGYLNNAAVPKNANMDGVSIKAALEGQAFDRGYLYWHYPHVSNQDHSSTLINGGSYVSAVSDQQFKLIFYYDDRHYELYNLVNDIGETTNLLGQNPLVDYNLSKALNGYLASVGALMPRDKTTFVSVALPTILWLSGDYNHNGVVDAADYTVWRDSLGQMGAGLVADGDANGKVEIADYIVWRDHLGLGSGAGAGSGSGAGGQLTGGTVPEPTIGMLAMSGFACSWGLFLKRRR